MIPSKAQDDDFLGRFREIISDPLNLLIERNPMAGIVEQNEVCLHNGNWVPISGDYAYYGIFSHLLALNRGVHEPLEEYIFQELLRVLPPAPTMIELGAYWGHYSMWLKRLRPQATVILVEPEQSNIQAGIQNFNRNGFKGMFIQSYVGRGNLEIDPFLRHQGVAHLNILHADIQGYEVEMLEGSRESLEARLIDYLFISTHSQTLHAQVVAELSRVGYRVEVSSDFDHDTTSCDGLVFASSPLVNPLFSNFFPLGRERLAVSTPEQLLQSLLAIKCNR